MQETQDQKRLKEEIKLLYYDSPLLFALEILPHHFTLKPAEFHKEIIDLLQQNYPKNCIVAPRGHAKSSLISLAYVLHQIVFCKSEFIILLSDTLSQSKYFLDAIKREFETNEKLIALFGNLVGSKWGEEEIETKTEIKIIALGAEQKIRGLKHRQHRPSLIVADDLENEELVSSPERRKKLYRWFNASVIPALASNGRIIIVGTILHYDSVLMKTSKDETYRTRFYKAKADNGTMLWPEHMDLAAWEQKRDDYRKRGLVDVFYGEWQNDPVNDENSIFKKDWFQYFSQTEKGFKIDRVSENSSLKIGKQFSLDDLNVFITVDLAISHRESADYTVILAAGIDSSNNIFVLEYERDRFTPMETIEKIFTMQKKYEKQFIRAGIESVGYQKSLQWFVEDEMKRRNQFFALEELRADTDKERRIRGLQPRYAIGSVYHRSWQTELEEEMLRFPKSPHEDILDALAYQPQIAFRASDPVIIPSVLADIHTYDQYVDKMIFAKIHDKHNNVSMTRNWMQVS